MLTKDITTKLQQNWKSGLTVALVSLPFSISLGVAAGATPLMGVLTAIWAGGVAAFLGGSNYNIVGPTGALSGLLANFALLHGASALPILAIMSGVIILAVYLLRWERYISLIPSSAIHGFTLGVAFIIGLNQLNFALGLSGLAKHERFVQNIMESFRHIGDTNLVVFGIFLVGLIFLLAWAKRPFMIPGPVILAAVGVGFGYVMNTFYPESGIPTLYTRFGDMPGSLLQIPHISFGILTVETVIAAVTIAMVAILETLISAKIADGMTKTKHRSRPEVLALGFANIFSGMFGGIPATAALARTALNVKTGATHRTSAFINAVIVAVITLAFFSWFRYLPLAIVASILVHIAIRMMSAEHFSHLYKYDRIAFYTSLVVALITVVQDPIVGILVGAVVSLLVFVNKISQLGGEVTINKDRQMIGRYHSRDLTAIKDHGDIVVYRFSGELTYINAQAHLGAVACINGDAKAVVLSFRNLYYIDIDGLDALQEIIETLQAKGKEVYICGMNTIVLSLLERTPWYTNLAQQHCVFDSSHEAISHFQVVPEVR